MKDKSCSGHKKENKLCYLEIKKGEIKYSTRFEGTVVADYNRKGELLGIEFAEGILKLRGVSK